MAHVTLKQLRYFDALARELHFGRAAEDCSVTQPALSMQIQDLESQLGVVLVERTRSGVLLTDHGYEIAKRSARILSEVRDLISSARQSNQPLAGSLHLGVIPSVAPYLLPPLLPLLRESCPDLELHVRETQTHQILTELVDGKLDLLLLALPIRHADIETVALFDDRFLLALPTTSDVDVNIRVQTSQVPQERLLLLEEGHCLREQALTFCSLQQSSSLNTFGASSLSTIVEMVAAGYGITLLPEICVGVEARGRPINLVRFAEPEPFRTLGLAWRTSSPRKDDFQVFAKLVTAAGTATKASASLPSRGRVSALLS